MTRVAFVGAGQMGMPMVERLVAAGHDVVVQARRNEVRAAVEALGATATPTLTDLGDETDIAIVCLYSDDQLAEVGAALAPSLPTGCVLASHVTGRVSTLTDIAARAPRIEVVDAPISGVPDDIRAGELTVLLGGSDHGRATADDVMSSYASPIVHTGGLGTALPLKLINNLVMAANTQLLADAVGLASRLGVQEAALLAALEHMSGGSRVSHYMRQHDGLTAFAQAITPYVAKDVRACREQSAELGLDLGLLGEVVDKGLLELA